MAHSRTRASRDCLIYFVQFGSLCIHVFFCNYLDVDGDLGILLEMVLCPCASFVGYLASFRVVSLASKFSDWFFSKVGSVSTGTDERLPLRETMPDIHCHQSGRN